MKIDEVVSICFHCGSDCTEQVFLSDEKEFCCEGCISVYRILHSNSMDQFYCLNDRPGHKISGSTTRNYPILDKESEAKRFITYGDEQITKASFYLPEIHCSSCIWLLEHLQNMDSGIIHSAVNFAEKRIYFTFNPKTYSLRKAAELLTSLGYEPHLDVESNSKGSDHSKKYMIYTGIAGFAFANIMMLSFSEYLGMSNNPEGYLNYYFRYLSIALSIPVLYVAYQIFFLSAYKSLIKGYINIDTPVSLAILVAFFRSIVDISQGLGSGFLDSMSGIVFFMLVGRYLQQRTFSSLQFNRNLKSFFPITAEVVQPEGGTISTYIQEVKTNQILKVRQGEIIPIDSEVVQGISHIDYSYITGESRPIDLYPGKQVFAGGKLLSNVIQLKVLKTFSASDFLQLWNNDVFNKPEDPGATWTDRVGAYFSVLVLVIASVSFLYWFGESQSKAWNAFTSVLIIACPCALLLSSSYTLGFMAQLFAKHGLFVKNTSVIDKMADLNHLVFDKTGTLTSSVEMTVRLVFKSWTDEERNMAMSLIQESTHPLSKAILRYQNDFHSMAIASWREIKGQGIEGWVNEHHLKIGTAEFVGSLSKTNKTEVLVSIEGALKAHFIIDSLFKPGVLKMLDRCNSMQLSLLSGDSKELYDEVSQSLPVGMTCKLGQSPQDKLDYIKSLQSHRDVVMMLGDGLNDAGALKQSDLGIAVVDQYHTFAPACDAILNSAKVNQIDQFINVAIKTKRLIYFAFGYAIVYNVLGLYYAVGAELKPIVAAILMPISSVGVILIAFLGSIHCSKSLTKMHQPT